MLSVLRRLAAFCLCITLSIGAAGLLAPASVHADDAAVLRRQASAFAETKSRLPELARLVSAEDWTFTRNLIHGPMQEVGREMLYINQRLSKSERKADRQHPEAGSGRPRWARSSRTWQDAEGLQRCRSRL